MRASGIVFFFVFTIALCGAQTKAGGPARKPSKPDVFLVTIDTLRADHVHCYGDAQIQTPTLDALANEGIRFTQAFTPSPITNTSHTTILTGLLPSSHGVTDFGIPLAPAHATWGELLKKEGYRTAAFIGAVILDSKTLAPGLDRGFDFYDNFPEHSNSNSRWGRVERRGMDVVQHAQTWLTQHRTGPHFVWVHLYDPHDPYEPPAPYAETYRDRLYDGEIAYADSAFGHFISYLKKNGMYDTALIIAVGDHGEGLGEHHEDTHGIFLYDSTTHVPLILKLPGQAPLKKLVEAQVRTTDILPTALDIVGMPPEQFDGESLKPLWTGTTTADRTVIGETDYPLRFGWAPLKSLREDGLKFIDAPRPELYNLQTDPRELQNNYTPNDSSVQKFRKQLADLKQQTDAQQTDSTQSAELPDPKDKIEEQNLLHSAMLASEDNQPEQARTALERVLSVDPKSPIALQQLGQLELASKNYGKAADYLKRALEVRPNDTAAALSLGQALDLAGNPAGAKAALETTLKLNPSQFPARLLLGQVELKLNNLSAAEDQLEAALLLQPKSPEAQISLGDVLVAQKKFPEAVQQLEPLTRTHPARQVYELLSKAYAGMGKQSEAQKAQTRAEDFGRENDPK
jgi:arylsulfatase A-like enzyme